MRNYDVINGLDPKYNAFDLSHNHYTTMPFGYLVPIAWFECIPGDIHDLNVQALVRCMPLLAPIMNNITCEVHAYFVPYRLLDDNFEAFYTTVDPKTIPPKSYDRPLPTWCSFTDVNSGAPTGKLSKDVVFKSVGITPSPDGGPLPEGSTLHNGFYAYVKVPVNANMAPYEPGYKWPPRLVRTVDHSIIDPNFYYNFALAHSTPAVSNCKSWFDNSSNVDYVTCTFEYTAVLNDDDLFSYDGVTTTINSSSTLIKHVEKLYKKFKDDSAYEAVFNSMGVKYVDIPGSNSKRFVADKLDQYLKDKYDLFTVPLDKYAPCLWDCFGFSREFDGTKNINAIPSTVLPFDLLRRAYYFIYNEWYRDENLQRPIDFKSINSSDALLQWCLRSSWRKDYFTAAFYSRQKGIAPAIPVTGSATVDFLLGNGSPSLPISRVDINDFYIHNNDRTGQLHAGPGGSNWINVGGPGPTYTSGQKSRITLSGQVKSDSQNSFVDWLNRNNKIDVSNLISLDVSDARDMFAIQRFFESLMRGGSRFIEMLQYQWNVSPSDARLSLPESIGQSSFNIQISEVLQNSATNDVSPQGNQTGHGFSLTDSGSLGSYKAEEPGVIMFIARIMPPAVYSQRLPREVMRKTLLEQVNPHFMNLSYQGILQSELYATGNSDELQGDQKIFAFQGRYDELREKLSYVSGDFYDTDLQSYLIFRKFSNPPALNNDFISCDPDEGDPFNNSIFVVNDEHPFLCNFYFNVKAMRKIPIISMPGLLDHVYGG